MQGIVCPRWVGPFGPQTLSSSRTLLQILSLRRMQHSDGEVRVAAPKPKSRQRSRTFRRLWNEARTDLELSSDDLASKQSDVAKENGIRPPTLARRWIDGSGGRGKRKWPYRHVRRVDRQIRKMSKQIVKDCLFQNAAVPLDVLALLSQAVARRSALVQPIVIKT